jgi:hypothetical protein
MNMRLKKIFQLMFLSAVLFVAASQAIEKDASLHIRAHVASGTNRFLGQPINDFGSRFGTAGFSNVGMFNPSGSHPLPLTPQTPESALLATFVDPDFLALVGKTASDVNPSLVNLPLRDVAVNADLAGKQRVPTVGIRSAQQTQPSQAEPAGPIRLADWARAEGSALIECEDGAANVRLRLTNLIPNRLYSVWGIFGGASGLFPFPIGGVPNVVVTDGRGNATFSRQLNFCPTQTKAGESQLLAIDVVFHSDNQSNGLVPELDFAGFFTGTTTNTQLEFLVTGKELQ